MANVTLKQPERHSARTTLNNTESTLFSIVSLCIFHRIQLVNQFLTSSQSKISSQQSKENVLCIHLQYHSLFGSTSICKRQQPKY